MTLRTLCFVTAVVLTAATSLAAAANLPTFHGIVEIQTNVHFQGSTWWGTGIVLTSSGEVLTNNHVIRGASSITVTDVDNGRTYRAKVAGYDINDDLAVLQLEDAAGLPTAALGNSALVRIGEPVTSYGAPDGPHSRPIAVNGRVTTRDESIREYDPYTGASTPLHGLISSDAPTRPGFSGGPVVASTGNVIGINTVGGIELRDSHLTFRSGAIPIDLARSIATAITARRSSPEIHIGPTALLGLTVQPGELYQGLTSGATVLTVIPGSPAARAGLHPGDIVQSLQGQTVTSADDLTALLTEAKPGNNVQISWLTPAGAIQTKKLRLSAGPPQ